MSKVTLRRDELVAEATAIYSAAPGSAVIADMMADFAMMIAARVAVRMMPPPGHVVVPREPTREMVLAAAGRKHEDDEETLFYGAIYRAMIAEATRKEDGE